MSDINWGILQSMQSMAPIHTAEPQASPAPASVPNPNAGMLDPLAAQKMQLERQQGVLAQHADARAQQLQPGLLQSQIDIHQKALSEQEAIEYGVQVRAHAASAFQAGQVRGGVSGGFDAAAQSMAQDGDLESASKLYKTNEELTQLKESGQEKRLASIGSNIYSIQASERPPVKDPKTGQVIDPGKTGLQIYEEQYPELKKLDSTLPDPKSFKDDQQFEDTFVHPVLAHALPALQKIQAEQKAAFDADIGKANAAVNVALSDYQSAVKTKGANSAEAQQAKLNLQNAQTRARAVAAGTTITGAVRSIVPDKTSNNIVNSATAQATGQPISTSTTSPSQTPPNLTFNLKTGKLE